MEYISEHKRIHLIGIGGCSMNGLAQILQSHGHQVQGSDRMASPFTERLAELGIPVHIGHQPENLGNADLVIYSAAIKPDNPERAAAQSRGIPALERSVALGQLSASYKEVLGVAGCHGKTTITSMLALITEQSAMDATVHVGGFVDFLHGGTRVGSHELFITEACEYVESFLTLKPTMAIINNIDDDHLDYYRDIEHITEAFRKFLTLLPEYGLFLGCTDDPRVQRLLTQFPGHSISYGMTEADYVPANIEYDALGNPAYDLMRHGVRLGRITLQVPGRHNIINSMAAAAAALALGADFPDIVEALGKFRNTRRRFEFLGERIDGAKVFHDYAHHPAEIFATLDAASRYPHRRLWCVFQCNSYTRAKTLFTGKVDCFADADLVLVPDIYPGREQDNGSVHARDMVQSIRESGTEALYLQSFADIRCYLDAYAQPGDIILTLGSGDVFTQSQKLL